MRAEIDKSGNLTIIPESQVESFALSTFWADFSENMEATGKGKYAMSVLGWDQAKETSIEIGENTI